MGSELGIVAMGRKSGTRPRMVRGALELDNCLECHFNPLPTRELYNVRAVIGSCRENCLPF